MSPSNCFMVRNKVVALLKIHPNEMRIVILVAVLFLCVQWGQAFGGNAAFALFLASIVAVSSIFYSILFLTIDLPFSERASNEFLYGAVGS
jgi:hypothetical protein